jgi:hypothetical protein
VEDRVVLRNIVGIDMASVQEAEMRGIDLALNGLQVIAVALDEGDANFVIGQVEDFERRQRRDLCLRPHVDPDDARALDCLIGLGFHLMLEILVRRHARHVDTVASDVVFPAVIDAADAAFLVASEEQRGAAVRTTVVHHADAALCVAKRDQLFAEQHQPDRRPVAHEFDGLCRGDPVLAHQFAHDRSGSDLGEFPSLSR